MVKKTPPKPKTETETRTSFVFPWLHKDVAKAVSHNVGSTRFCNRNSDGGATQEYQTHVMGRFRCTKDACPTKGWSSKKIAILIRGYENNGYNAVVFNQRCKACDTLGTLTLDKQSYVDRVAYRIQKWAGVEVEKPQFGSNGGIPHETEFCEGCKRGVCRQSSDWQDM